MEVSKAIKKMVAVGAGATMMGATLLGAMAASDLANYPTMFIKDGKLNALIVLGDDAKVDDVIGAIDVTSSLQYAMQRKVTVQTGAVPSTVVEGGAKITAAGKSVKYGDLLSDIKETITETDLPILLKKGTIKADVESEYTMKIKVPSSKVQYDKEILDTTDPQLVLRFDSGEKYTMEITFQPSINITKATNKKITLFGKDYTLSGDSNDLTTSKIVMYGGGVKKILAAGDKATVSIGGSDVEVEVKGVDTQAQSAMIIVNNEAAQVEEGETVTVGNVKVYIKDVYAYDIPTKHGEVELFIGSDKLTIENSASITLGSKTLVGTTGHIDSSGGKISKITIDVTPEELENYVEAIKLGDSLVDPVFGSFKISFTGITPGLTDAAREVIKFSPSDSALKLAFKNKDGKSYDVEFLKPNATNNGLSMLYGTSGKKFVAGYDVVNVGDAFVLSENGYTDILKLVSVTNTTSTREIVVQNLASGGSSDKWSFDETGKGSMTYTHGTNYNFTITASGSSGSITLDKDASTTIWTQQGAMITLPVTDGTGLNKPYIDTIYFNESGGFISGTYKNDQKIRLNVTYESKSGSDIAIDEIRLSTNGNTVQVGDTHVKQTVTGYGTFIKQDTSDSAGGKLEIYYYGSEATYDVFIAPTEAAVIEAGGAGTVETITLEKIQVGTAKKAKEISDYKAQNLIVIGGPCANSIAAAVMGNPADCTAGFTPGKAIIKLYDTSATTVAMVVAGYSGEDTTRACRVIANYKDYATKLKGTEVEVSGTSMTDITVAAPTIK